MSSIKCIAFDLDDTLLDTTRLLVPAASTQAYEAMRSLGLDCRFEDYEQMRVQMAPAFSHKEIFKKVAEKFAPHRHDEITEAGIHHFYNPKIPAQLPLIEGANEVLETLKSKYTFFLVTSGAIETQRKKVEATGQAHYFKKLFFVDGFRNQRKQDAFAEIIQIEKIHAQQLLSVGNRLHQEIRQAKMCGAQTCYFEYGEHVGEKPECKEDHPDFVVHQMKDLIKICNL